MRWTARLLRTAALVALVAVLSPTASPAEEAAPVTVASKRSPIDHVRSLSSYGPRTPGSSADRRGQRYIVGQLESWGYLIRYQTVRVPGGRTTRNIIAIKPGFSRRRVLIGSHMDSKSPSPGANDNASGCAVTLELARRLSSTDVTPTVVFAFFGAEEIVGRYPWQHHFGSTYYAEHLDLNDRMYLNGMISVDMVGVGTELHTRTMNLGPRTLERSLRRRADILGYGMTWLRDPGKYGWSDHEAFERAGYPTAWIEWRDDPNYHTKRDTAGRVSEGRMNTVVRILDQWVRHTNASDLYSISGW